MGRKGKVYAIVPTSEGVGVIRIHAGYKQRLKTLNVYHNLFGLEGLLASELALTILVDFLGEDFTMVKFLLGKLLRTRTRVSNFDKQ